tara:strand:- start:947 stop:1096 length:150 start_codon:yes stop_codon:yes gene_type:complete
MNELKRLNEMLKLEAEEILGGKDTLKIRQFLTKKELKKLQRKMRKILSV